MNIENRDLEQRGADTATGSAGIRGGECIEEPGFSRVSSEEQQLAGRDASSPDSGATLAGEAGVAAGVAVKCAMAKS